MNRNDQCECNHFRSDHAMRMFRDGRTERTGRCVFCDTCSQFALQIAADHVYCTAEMLDEIIAVGTLRPVAYTCRHCGKSYDSVNHMEQRNREVRASLENEVALARVRLPEILKDVRDA